VIPIIRPSISEKLIIQVTTRNFADIMEFFLEKIAGSLYAEFGNTLNRHCLVFPNRRAGLYLMKYLASVISKPVWTPAIYTINDLFTSFSSLRPVSGEILLFELYRVYSSLKKSPESFDDFYFWGDMLLNDFDDVDKYLVDASALFQNIRDIKNIDNEFGDLTESQVEIIRRFWISFNPDKPTPEKTGFIDIWSVLYEVYEGLRDSLRGKNMAYEGMIFRDVAGMTGDGIISGIGWDMVHFIGFNALNECEKEVMKQFRKAGKARFYWDYDNSYISDGKLNSAGYFMRDNLKTFGNDMPPDWNYDAMLSAGPGEVKRRVIETSSDIAQVKLLPALIGQLPEMTEENAHHTAIVLADENLLLPVLSSLPENIGDINITMGYPLRDTLVYTLVRDLMELQRNARISGESLQFGYRDALSILRHPLAESLLDEADKKIIDEITETNLLWVPSARFTGSKYLSGVFTRPGSPLLLSGYFRSILILVAAENAGRMAEQEDRTSGSIINEFIYRIVLSLNRLETVLNKGEIKFTPATYMRILDRMLRLQAVPFSGEPLSGLQVMGILETRALDFKNLVILSVNEGILPSVSAGASFIPFNLREAFGLPSINHQESVYAYHFYRLLQRAGNVTFLFNSNSDGLITGEMSRFLLQMKYDRIMKPEFLDLNFDIRSHSAINEAIERSDEHLELLSTRFLDPENRRILSPSAINTWLNCRMKFFYRYVNGLKEPEKITEEIDPAMVGEILHEVMKNLYSVYTGRIMSKEIIREIAADRRKIEKKITQALDARFSGGEGRTIAGTEYIIRDVLFSYIQKIFRTDILVAPFSILHLETSFSFPSSINFKGKAAMVMTGGIIDRIDLLAGVTRIVDYKTGTVAERINSIGDLFEYDRKRDLDGWLQTLIYCEAFIQSGKGERVRPSIYRIRNLSSAPDKDRLSIRSDGKNDFPVEDYSLVRDEFMSFLASVTDEIFSTDLPFVMTGDTYGKCSWCPYRGLCMR
jgi:hypothetical protein